MRENAYAKFLVCEGFTTERAEEKDAILICYGEVCGHMCLSSPRCLFP